MIFSSRFCMLFVVLVLCIRTQAMSQVDSTSIKYGLGSTAYIGKGNELPFWFYANSDGVVEPRSSNLVSHFYSHYNTLSSDGDLRLHSGLDLYQRVSSDNTWVFTQLYAGVGYKFLNLKVGRFYDPVGLNDDDLTMGSMMVSRNATPVPKIQLSTDGFTNIPFTNGHLQFDAMISHGWLKDDRYVKDAYLHQKYLYLKANFGRFGLAGGMIHNVIWGGKDPQRGQLPSSFSDFLRVLTGASAAKNSNAPESDKMNAIGNMIAAYDFRANVNFDHFKFKAYRLFFLEDRVDTRFRSPWDGVWGLDFDREGSNHIIDEILWEHMNTKRQGAFDYEARGQESYYNHSTYKSGWAYENRVLGNPLILYGPNPNFVGQRAISNNIIVAHHIGIQGQLSDQLAYKTFFTYSRNYGTVTDQTHEDPNVPLSKIRVDEYSALLQGVFTIDPASGLSITGGVALDIGKLYAEENRIGFQLGVKWDRIAQ